MPGVHSDIGGGYKESFISTVSLLTMIDKLAQYCPKVAYDRGYIKKYLLPLLKSNVVVHKERYFAFTDFGAKRVCENTSHDLKQSVHPLLPALRCKPVLFKGKTASYMPSYTLSDPAVNLPVTKFCETSYYHTDVAARIHRITH